ncbi:hypothetical protein [Crucivirus-483]|nr:hypothetical protein [Crucivirus-483]
MTDTRATRDWNFPRIHVEKIFYTCVPRMKHVIQRTAQRTRHGLRRLKSYTRNPMEPGRRCKRKSYRCPTRNFRRTGRKLVRSECARCLCGRYAQPKKYLSR